MAAPAAIHAEREVHSLQVPQAGVLNHVPAPQRPVVLELNPSNSLANSHAVQELTVSMSPDWKFEMCRLPIVHCVASSSYAWRK